MASVVGSGVPGSCSEATSDAMCKLELHYTYDARTLCFSDEIVNKEFDDQLLHRRYLVLAVWFAVFLVLVVGDSLLNPYAHPMAWALRVWHVGMFIPPVCGTKFNWERCKRNLTWWTTFCYTSAVVIFCLYFIYGANQEREDAIGMVSSHTFSISVGYLVMLTAWTFVLHLPVLVVLITQLGMWHAMCKVFLMLQLLPGVRYSNPVYQHVLCMTTALVMTGIIYWMMRNTVLLFIQRKMAVAREQDIAMREIEFKQRYVAQTLHDIGTPLTTLSFGNQILRSSKHIPPELMEVVETQAVAVEMMTLTRRKAIDFTKLSEEGRLRPRLGAVDIRDIVLNKCQRLMTGYTTSKAVKMLCSVDDDVATHILSDRDWVWEMCVNLLSNARKFTHRGSIETTVSLVPAETTAQTEERRRSGSNLDTPPTSVCSSSQPTPPTTPLSSCAGYSPLDGKQGPNVKLQPELLIEVKDSGIGVPPDKVHKLFQPFSQLQVGAGGTGLGLYGILCKSRTLRGDAGYRPNPSGGSIFYIRLPYIEVDLGHTDEMLGGAEGLVVGDQVANEDHSRCTSGASDLAMGLVPSQVSGEVLIVDDDAMSRRLMGRMLQNMGCTTQAADSGEEALQLLKEKRFALTFLDLDLPALSGLQVIEKLRRWELERGKQREQHRPASDGAQPLVVLSGTILDEDRQQALDKGANEFLSKPVSPALLETVVRRFLKPPKRRGSKVSSNGDEFKSARSGRSSPHGPRTVRDSFDGPSREGLPRKVLLVEDEKSIAKLTRRMLQSTGYEVEWAANGMEGLMKMQESRGAYWACLCDLNMPLLDGFEMVRRYRAWESEQLSRDESRTGCPLGRQGQEEHPRDYSVPLDPTDLFSSPASTPRRRRSSEGLPLQRQFIAALSACSTDEDMRLAEEAGIDAFLSKPAQLPVMLASLEERRATLPRFAPAHGKPPLLS